MIQRLLTSSPTQIRVLAAASRRCWCSSAGRAFPQTPEPYSRCPTLLVHGEEDEVFPVADTVRLADCLRTNGVAVTLRVVPGVGHDLSPERGVVFRGVGVYCLAHLVGPEWWRQYHSIAEWQAEAPGIGWFWIPAAAWVLWKSGKRKADKS